MNPATSTPPAKGRRPSDTFNGAAVKRKFVEEVRDIIRKAATSHQTFIKGTLASSSEAKRVDRQAGAHPLDRSRQMFSIWDERLALISDRHR